MPIERFILRKCEAVSRREDKWGNLDAAVGYGKHNVTEPAEDLHPTDVVEYYRDIAKYATGIADTQAETNERDGVPE